jgi:hypothetical protein
VDENPGDIVTQDRVYIRETSREYAQASIGHQRIIKMSICIHIDCRHSLTPFLFSMKSERRGQSIPTSEGPFFVAHIPATPVDSTVEAFWTRVGQLSTRMKVDKRWLGSEELVQWHKYNLTVSQYHSHTLRNSNQRCLRINEPCLRCSENKRRICIVEADHPSCKTCRTSKKPCDRKLRFLFDLTRKDFFHDFDQFCTVYDRGPPHQSDEAESQIVSKKRKRQQRPSEDSQSRECHFHNTAACYDYRRLHLCFIHHAARTDLFIYLYQRSPPCFCLLAQQCYVRNAFVQPTTNAAES